MNWKEKAKLVLERGDKVPEATRTACEIVAVTGGTPKINVQAMIDKELTLINIGDLIKKSAPDLPPPSVWERVRRKVFG